MSIFSRKTEEKFKKALPYIIVLLSFSLAILLLVIIIDSFLLPSMILNKDTVQVPNVTGMQYEIAQNLLKDKNLVISKVTEQYSETVPRGTIINQLPKAGQSVKVGRTIYLTVSKGLETLQMPSVIGQPLRAARIALMNKGLKLGDVTYDYNSMFGNDTVVQQSIMPGSNIAYGNVVTLVVSKGPESQVLVPMLVGSTLDKAAVILSESGLVLGKITYEKSETFYPNSVLHSDPNAGEVVNRNTPVDVKVSTK